LALKEVVPRKMKIDFEVGLILVERSLIGLLSLNIVFGFFVQEAYLQECVYFPLDRESVCKN